MATGRDRLWAHGRSWYGVSLIGGTSCASTWYSFLSTDAKRTSSAVQHISSKEGELRDKNPNLCNFNMKFCSCCLWPISAYPYHAGDAYNFLASVVARVTSQRVSPGRSCERRTLSAYIDCAACLRAMSICALNERMFDSETPNIFIISMRWIPGMGVGYVRCSLPTHGLLTIISVDLVEFNSRLLAIAHSEMFSNSMVIVL